MGNRYMYVWEYWRAVSHTGASDFSGIVSLHIEYGFTNVALTL